MPGVSTPNVLKEICCIKCWGQEPSAKSDRTVIDRALESLTDITSLREKPRLNNHFTGTVRSYLLNEEPNGKAFKYKNE